eukprot:UN30251
MHVTQLVNIVHLTLTKVAQVKILMIGKSTVQVQPPLWEVVSMMMKHRQTSILVMDPGMQILVDVEAGVLNLITNRTEKITRVVLTEVRVVYEKIKGEVENQIIIIHIQAAVHPQVLVIHIATIIALIIIVVVDEAEVEIIIIHVTTLIIQTVDVVVIRVKEHVVVTDVDAVVWGEEVEIITMSIAHKKTSKYLQRIKHV